MINNIEDLSEEELVKEVGERVIGTPSGINSQQAQAELTRRLIISLRKLKKSSSFHSWILGGLTIALVILATTQIYLFLSGHEEELKEVSAKIEQIDKHNWNIACEILQDLAEEKGIPVWVYNTEVYFDNLGFIANQLYSDTKERIRNNLSWMTLSNNMVLAGLQNSQVQDQVRNNLGKPAREIMKNLEAYRPGINNIDCTYFKED